jgi:hypothetical protein
MLHHAASLCLDNDLSFTNFVCTNPLPIAALGPRRVPADAEAGHMPIYESLTCGPDRR